MTQYERSAATLELPAVLAMLEREAVSDLAKARAAALTPSTDEAEVRRRLAETSAARSMMVPAAARASRACATCAPVCSGRTWAAC